MGVIFAKSIKFGAIRFNFSGSGIWVSAGGRGLRIGTGPAPCCDLAGKWIR